MLSLCVATVAAGALLGPAIAQDLCESRPPVDSEELQSAIKLQNLQAHAETFEEIAFATPYFRAAGSIGYNRTVDYITEQIEALGDYYTIEKQTYSDYAEFFNEGALTIDGEEVESSTFQFSRNGTFEDLELVWVNSYGCNGTEDFPPEVEGNIGLISRGPEGGSCAFATKSANAGTAGAVALIVFDYVPGAGPINGVLSIEDPPQGPTIPTSSISNELGLDLSARIQAGEEIIVDSFYTATYGDVVYSENVFATTTCGDPDNILFLGAHLDSVPEGPGINDNGSGSIAILEVARQLSAFVTNSTVRFAWWTAEESGLLGSTYYVTTADPEELLKVRLYLNFDMVASGNGIQMIYDGDGSDFGLTGPPGSAEAEAMYEEYFEERDLPYRSDEFSGRSDYGPFLDANVPSGGLFTGADGVKTEEEAEIWGGTPGIIYDPNYHTLYDTIGNWSYAFLYQNTKAIAHSVAFYGAGFEGFPEREPPNGGGNSTAAVTRKLKTRAVAGATGLRPCSDLAVRSGNYRRCNAV